MARPTAIVTDIEGTTTPIAFVRDELFPYARAHLEAFLQTHGTDPAVVEALAHVAALAPGQDAVAALRDWMDADAKVPPLKALQGMIWHDGYARGDLRGRLYADVPRVLRRWHADGQKLYVYSSGSTGAQKLLFSHTEAGDLSTLFSGFFDTRVGGKRDTESYGAIASAVALPTADILFLSDVEQELDAADLAGFRCCQLVREGDGTVLSERHPSVSSFDDIENTAAWMHGKVG